VAELLQHVLRHPKRIGIVADVGLGEDRMPPDLPDLLGNLLGRRLARDVIDRDVSAFFGEGQRDGAPMPRDPPVTSAVRPLSFMEATSCRRDRQSSMACSGQGS
jgi:hypothetical protein